MPLDKVQSMRLHSSSGEIEQIEYDGDGDPIYVGVAPFGAADDAPVWFIDKLDYITVGGEKCPTPIQRSGVQKKWTDRTNATIMGWR